MSERRRAVLRVAATAMVVAGAVAVLAVVVAALRTSRPSVAPPPSGLAATASLTPRVHLFGDTVTARISLRVDARRVDPDRIEVRARFAPYTVIEPFERTRRDVGDVAQLEYRARIRCLTAACAPPAGIPKRITFPSASVTYRPRANEDPPAALRAPRTGIWPSVVQFSRLDRRGSREEADPDDRPPWRADTSLPSVSYRVRPDLAFWGLIAGALTLLVGAALVLRPYLPARAESLLRRRRRVRLAPPLERALAAVEAARAAGDAPEQRKALELLSDELMQTGEPQLALAARHLAWSARNPDGEATRTLARDVRHAIETRSNGHGF